MLVWCGLHKVVSSLTSFLGAREIRVRTPTETPLEDMLYLMHCFLCCVSNTNERSQVMDCYPVRVNVIWNPRSQVVVWNRHCNIASPHLRPAHASPSFQNTLSLLLVNFIFFPNLAQMSSPHICSNRIMHYLSCSPIMTCLYFSHQFYFVVCIHVFTYGLYAPKGQTFCICCIQYVSSIQSTPGNFC